MLLRLAALASVAVVAVTAQCTGPALVIENTGRLELDSVVVSANGACAWRLKAQEAHRVHLTFNSFPAADAVMLTVYDGASVHAPIMEHTSAALVQWVDNEFISSGEDVLVVVSSDAASDVTVSLSARFESSRLTPVPQPCAGTGVQTEPGIVHIRERYAHYSGCCARDRSGDVHGGRQGVLMVSCSCPPVAVGTAVNQTARGGR